MGLPVPAHLPAVSAMARYALPPVLLALLAATAPAQPAGLLDLKGGPPPKSFAEVATVTAEVVPPTAKPGETVRFKLTVTPKPGAWTYPTRPADAGQLSKNTFVPPPPGAVIFVGPVADPPGVKTKPRDEAKPDGPLDQVYTRPTTWEFTAVVAGSATPGPKSVRLDDLSRVQTCTAGGLCFNAKELPAAKFVVADAPPVAVEERFRAEVEKALAAPARGTPAPPTEPTPAKSTGDTLKTAKPADDYQAEVEYILAKLDKSGTADPTKPDQGGGLWGFVLTAAVWGLVSLVTPCVFPMIPITVSIFLKQAGGSVRERVKLAGVYCLTIISVLGVSAFALLKFMAILSAHPVTNVLLGGLFVVLALSLFGMYELTLPNGLARRFQSGQSKGGVAGTVAGALAFTVISFTCVAPFLGGFAGISAADSGGGSLIALPTWRDIAGGLAFATAFAAPFFILALVPGLLKALPRSGGWLDSVKVVMGFLELAAALKFFRTAELRVFSPPAYFTYDLVLAGWVAIAFACGLYLLNQYRLPHDEEKPGIGVPRLLFALLFLGFGVYLAPALLKGTDGRQRPAGAVYAWVDAFLLPEPGRKGDQEWGTDLKESLARSRAEKLAGRPAVPVFVDFTGETCTNCSYNESEVFPRPAVREQLAQFERVKLYTDDVPAAYYSADPGLRARRAEARANGDFKVKAFGTDQLPLYAVLLPTLSGGVKVLGVYDEGKINDPDRFAAFLKDMRAVAGR